MIVEPDMLQQMTIADQDTQDRMGMMRMMAMVRTRNCMYLHLKISSGSGGGGGREGHKKMAAEGGRTDFMFLDPPTRPLDPLLKNINVRLQLCMSVTLLIHGDDTG